MENQLRMFPIIVAEDNFSPIHASRHDGRHNIRRVIQREVKEGDHR